MSEEIVRECPDCRYEKVDVRKPPCSKCRLGCFDVDAPLLFEAKEADDEQT